MEGKYSIELFRKGDEGAVLEAVLDQYNNLGIARAFYKAMLMRYPGRLIMLRDRARVLARSDRPNTTPS